MTIGDDMRRPDVVGLSLSAAELVAIDGETLTPAMIEIAVEVISHSRHSSKDRIAVERDRIRKSREYAWAGILEYWIVDRAQDDLMDASVEMYRLKDGAYGLIRTVLLSELLAEGGAEDGRAKTA